jgi:hypothetical protein
LSTSGRGAGGAIACWPFGSRALDDQLLEVQGGEQRAVDPAYNPTVRTSGEDELSDIDTMPAGREMDVLIAEDVMGWEQHCHTGRMMWCLPYPGHRAMAIAQPEMTRPVTVSDDSGDHDVTPFHPSTDIAAAWRVVEKMKERHWFLLTDRSATEWYAAFSDKAKAREISAPLAICRAALRAV